MGVALLDRDPVVLGGAHRQLRQPVLGGELAQPPEVGRESSGSAAAGGIVINPRTSGYAATRAPTSSGATPDFDGSPERFTSISAGTVPLAADSEASECTSSQIPLTTLALLD